MHLPHGMSSVMEEAKERAIRSQDRMDEITAAEHEILIRTATELHEAQWPELLQKRTNELNFGRGRETAKGGYQTPVTGNLSGSTPVPVYDDWYCDETEVEGEETEWETEDKSIGHIAHEFRAANFNKALRAKNRRKNKLAKKARRK